MPKELFENPDTQEDIVIAHGEGMAVDRIEFNKGILIYLKGHDYPQKGAATKEAIGAINVAKSAIVGLLGLGVHILPLVGIKRLVRAFNAITWRAVAPQVLKYEFLTPTAQATLNFVMTLCVEFGVPFKEAQKTAQTVAAIVEYDSAYRFRLMDVLTESSKEQLVGNPRKEVKRLLELNRERDYQEVSDKMTRVGRVVTYALLIPKFKKAFVKAIKGSQFSKFKYDAADIYWAYHKRDYQYLGKTYEERTTLLNVY